MLRKIKKKILDTCRRGAIVKKKKKKSSRLVNACRLIKDEIYKIRILVF